MLATYERAFLSSQSLRDPFEARLRRLSDLYGEPVLESKPDWYPNAVSMAKWIRPGKTLLLILTDETRCGAAIILWCVSKEELDVLKDAAVSRAVRVSSISQFDGYLRRQLARLAEAGF